MDIDIIEELKMLNMFVDPRPRMTITRAIAELADLRADLAEKEKECDNYLSFLIREWPAGGWILHLHTTGKRFHNGTEIDHGDYYFKEYSDAKQALAEGEGHE